MNYLRRLWQRVTAPRKCPVCGGPFSNREQWLLHMGLDHPVEAEWMLGRLHPDAWARYLENRRIAQERGISPQE